MNLGKNFFALALCCLLNCCTWRYEADTAQSINANQSGKQSAESLVEQFGNKLLLDQLKREQGIEEPFAWERWDGKQDGGTVIGIDQKGKLKRVEFTRTADGYTVKASDYVHELNDPIEMSGDLRLGEYLPNTEFPFNSYIISAGNCKIHFVILWQARNRSFQKRTPYLDAIDLRILVEQDGKIVSNNLEELLFDRIDKILVEDVNKDGNPDFLIIGSNRSTFIRIWSAVSDCAVKQLLFKEDEDLLQYVGDKGLSITRNKKTGSYDIHIQHYEYVTNKDRLYMEVTESIYQWDPIKSIYIITNSHTRLSPAENK